VNGNTSGFFDNDDSKLFVKNLNEEIGSAEGIGINNYLTDENKALTKELEDVKNDYEDALNEIDYLNAKIEELNYNFNAKLIQQRLDIAKKMLKEQAVVDNVMKAFEK
jgi:hypothetical protein